MHSGLDTISLGPQNVWGPYSRTLVEQAFRSLSASWCSTKWLASIHVCSAKGRHIPYSYINNDKVQTGLCNLEIEGILVFFLKALEFLE